MAFDVFVHRGNAFYATFTEIQATVTNQAGALQEVRDNHRLKYVQLELPVGAGYRDCHVVTHYLSGEHRQ